MVGLYASFCIAIVISFIGGRPGMISAATGAMALVMADLIKDYGLQYLLAATILTGILQILLGVCKMGRLLKFIPRPVMIGFVNSLAILIFTAQLTHFVGETWVMYAMTAGAFLLILIVLLNDVLVKIPMAALVAVMIMVSISTFNWLSLKKLHIAPKSDTAVMLVTVIIVLYTHDLSKGVLAGVILSMVFFSVKLSKVTVTHSFNKALQQKTYTVHGPLFFASVQDFVSQFDLKEEVKSVVIDFTHSKIWDDSAVGAIDKVVLKYRVHGTNVQIFGLDHESSTLINHLSVYDKKPS